MSTLASPSPERASADRVPRAACPGCASDTTRYRAPISAEYSWRSCGTCGLVFADPMRGAPPEHYSSSHHYTAKHLFAEQLDWCHREFLRRRPAAGGRLLDVGCGTGGLLAAAQRAGYRVEGLDFDPGSVEVARRTLGTDAVHCADLRSFGRTAAPFDAITAFEVIEHVESPGAFLESARALLRPGGLLVLSTPNRERLLDPLGAGDEPPNHLTRWSADALRGLIERMRLRVVCLRVKPICPWEVSAAVAQLARLGLGRRILGSIARGGAGGLSARLKTLVYRAKTGLQHAAAIPIAAVARWYGGGSDLYCEAARDDR